MTEEFVTIDSVTGHLPAAVEDRIVEIAGTSGGGGGGDVSAETARALAAEALLMPLSMRSAANGVAPLGAGGKVTPSFLATTPGPGKYLALDSDNNSKWVTPSGVARNVLDFGADRTGGADCRPAFDAAIAASLADSSGAAILIEAPPGSYIFDSPITPVVDTAFAMRGAGYRNTLLLASKNFHANFPGRYLLHATGTGTSDGQVLVERPTTPATGPFTQRTVGPFKSGWDTVLGSAGADATINLRTGTLVGTGTLTVSLDQSNDPTFATGVTTATVTFNDTEPNADKSMGNGGVSPNNGAAFWTAHYFRIRYTLTGSPTSWPITITYNNNYNVLTGIDLAGFAINAAGSPTTANMNLGMDADGRWNTKGILLDRAKWADVRNVWVNKARGQGLRLREFWDSSLVDVKVLKCGDGTALTPAMACEPFNEWVTNSTSNNSTFVQIHLEDNKYTQLYLGRRTRRMRFFGLKCHGDLASNTVMTIAPHVRLESAYSNQFFGYSMNRAGQSHFELDVHPAEQAQHDAGQTLAGGFTTSDRNAFVAGYHDSARTNTALAPGGTASVHVIRGSYNRWAECTWSANPKAVTVEAGVGNLDNIFAETCEYHDFYDGTGALTGNVSNELSGPVWATWRNPATQVRYRWDGTTLTTLSDVSGGGGGSTAALAQVRFLPSPTQTTATIATTTSDIAAAGIAASWTGVVAATFDLTFTVPASLKVMVEVEALTKGSTTGTATRFTITDPAGGVTYSQVASTTATSTTQTRSRYKMLVDYSGVNATVAAGTVVTIRPQITAASGTVSVDVGGANGPVMASVYTA